MVHIPEDVVSAIIETICRTKRSKATLLACHAISREWSVVTRKYLFRNITVTLPRRKPSEKLWKTLDFVTTHPHIASCIRSLCIRGYTKSADRLLMRPREQVSRSSMDPEPLYRTLMATPELKVLHLHKLPPCIAPHPTQMEPPPTVYIPDIFIVPDNVVTSDALGIFHFLDMLASVGGLHISRVLELGDPKASHDPASLSPAESRLGHVNVHSLEVQHVDDSFLGMITQEPFLHQLRRLEANLDFWNYPQNELDAFFSEVSASLAELVIRTHVLQSNTVDLSICRKLECVTITADLVDVVIISSRSGDNIASLMSAIDFLSTLVSGVHGPIDTLQVLNITLSLEINPFMMLECLERALPTLIRFDEALVAVCQCYLKKVQLRVDCWDDPSLKEFFVDALSKSIASGTLAWTIGE